MELIPGKTTHTVGSDVHDRSLIAEFIACDLHILRQITIIISQKRNVPRSVAISLERSYGRFKLWSDGYGVLSGELDQPFEKSLILRRATWTLVKEISIIITERLMPLADLDILDPSDNTPGVDSSVSVKSLDEEEIAEDLMDLTSSLADLRSLIESPFDQDDFKSVTEDLKVSTPSEPIQDKTWTQSAWSKVRKRQNTLLHDCDDEYDYDYDSTTKKKNKKHLDAGIVNRVHPFSGGTNLRV
ncbi:hypothetical protein G7054_g14570 [Neopestalotiopsis clavispora]|nr:hypothetical protein G7054_g14570 [Neopestalotiopsis clavispora]